MPRKLKIFISKVSRYSMRKDRRFPTKIRGDKNFIQGIFPKKSLEIPQKILQKSLRNSLDSFFRNNRSRRIRRSTISLVSRRRRRSRAVSAVGTSRCGTSRRETAIDNCKCERARARGSRCVCVCACACVRVCESVRLADSARRHSISSPGMAIARC